MVALLVALLSLLPPPPDHAPSALDPILVTDGTWSGLALVWDAPARRLLTPLHVVEEMRPEAIVVVLPRTGPVPGRIVDQDPALDLAVLEVAADLPAAPPLRTATGLAADAPVWLPGCGGARAADTGRILVPLRKFAGSTYVSVRTAVAPGWSGRPIVDADGALIGIVDLALLREPGTALAIPAARAVARFPR